MKSCKLYQVDAFTDKLFGGNPAAVCPLNHWLDDKLLQQIAMENNLAETAFYVKTGNHYQIKWFTPTVEVDLCGHATLATSFVLFNYEGHTNDTIHFHSHRSGELLVSRFGDVLVLDFPKDEYHSLDTTSKILDCFDLAPITAYKGKTDYMLVYETESQILAIVPNMEAIAQLDGRGVIITAKGNEVDFVSRFFAPQSGITEDPVTGSAHTTLIPYWAERLKKNKLKATQLSKRRGFLDVEYAGERVKIGGQCQLYLRGQIELPSVQDQENL